MNTPKGNWTRTPRLTPDELHARALARRDHRKAIKMALGVGDDAFWVPHRNRPAPARKHRRRDLIEQIRMFPGSGPVSRLSMVR